EVENGCNPLEAVALAHERINDIYLDVGVLSEVRQGGRRPDVGKDEVLVVPDGCRALGREVRSTVGADRGNEAETLLPDDSLHVVSQKSHRLTSSSCCPTPTRSGVRTECPLQRSVRCWGYFSRPFSLRRWAD